MIALTGVRRVLVNEAGVGTASMMHGASKNNEPVREGLVAMIGPSRFRSCMHSYGDSRSYRCKNDPSIMPARSGMSSMEGLKFAINAFYQLIPAVGGYLLL